MNCIRRARLALLLAAAVPLAALPLSSIAATADGATLEMETHAAFFSAETKQPDPLDPQVFVRDAKSRAGTGPQQIRHGAGLRPARIADDRRRNLFNANGQPLHFSLGQWLGARGTAHVAADGRTVTVRLSGLRARGTYSLFENHFDQQPIGFTPLDGTGRSSTFVAGKDGKATITVEVPQPLSHANAVLLVYHSDGRAHGSSRGQIGVNAHHHMIARVP